MKKNIRLPVSFSQEMRGHGRIPFLLPLAISFICHLVFLILLIVAPGLQSEKPRARSVINVSMVSFKKTTTQPAERPTVAKKTPKIKKPKVVKKAKTPLAVEKPAAKVAEQKPKTSLKKKTFKSTRVVKQTIEQMEPKTAETQSKAETQPEPLQSALERLKQQVGKEEADRSAQTSSPEAQTGGKSGTFNENGKKTAERIDLYRLEVAFQVQKQWAFNEQLAGGDPSLVTAIVFKVMPDGEIRDIFFTDRSGNDYLDESAYKAIVKSNPVDRHPQGLQRPYVVVAIRFTPQGIR
jgi:colicin import membrane protein